MPRKQAIEFSDTDYRVRQIVEDCIDICLARDRVNWSCERTELVKSLRGSRYSFYGLRSGRTWKINSEQEQMLYDLLVNQGFELSDKGVFSVTSSVHKPGHIPFDPPLHSNPKFVADMIAANIKAGMPAYLAESKGKKYISPDKKPKKAGIRLIALPEDDNVEELLEILRESKDQGEKKRLRAKLRSLGHQGGLRGQ